MSSAPDRSYFFVGAGLILFSSIAVSIKPMLLLLWLLPVFIYLLGVIVISVSHINHVYKLLWTICPAMICMAIIFRFFG